MGMPSQYPNRLLCGLAVSLSRYLQETLPDLRAWRLRFQTLFFEKSMGKSLERLKQDVTKAMTGF